MAHKIMDEKRFYSLRKPAWHGLGYVSEVEHTITEVAEHVGVPRIFERPVAYQGAENWYKVPDKKALVGFVDGRKFCYDIVSKHYALVTHEDIINTWRKCLEAVPVETLGILNNGDVMFCTTLINRFDIGHGDTVQNYLTFMNPIGKGRSIKAYITPVRVVCQNTLNLSLKETTYELNVVHKANPLDKVEEWLVETWENCHLGTEVLQENFEALQALQMTPDTIKVTLDHIYPLPEEKQEKAYAKMNERRDKVCSIMEGSNTIAQDMRNTAWGMYNAVCEYEDYFAVKKGRTVSSQMSQMFGSSARRKEQAFARLTNMVGVA